MKVSPCTASFFPVFSPFSQYWLVRTCFKPAVLHPDSSPPHLRDLEDSAGCAGRKGYFLAQNYWAISPYHCMVIPGDGKRQMDWTVISRLEQTGTGQYLSRSLA